MHSYKCDPTITEQFGLEGSQSPPSPNHCHGQGCPPPAQAAQGPIQPGLERLQELLLKSCSHSGISQHLGYQLYKHAS